VVNPVEAKVIIEVSRKYVSLFRCDGTGAILDYDHFAFPFRLDRQDAVSEALDIFARLYDHMNTVVNGSDDSARGTGPDAKTE
jgi:hypothetical protein